MAYEFSKIEKKWREWWLKEKTFKTIGPGDPDFDPKREKCYILDMFPYPSGVGLHIGHPKGYIATDIYSRFKRMQNFNVLHPMGFDSFGLPAENYAVENNVHPAVFTEKNIDNMREQFKFLGLGYDWDREITTSREDYYRWTQWIFLQLFNAWFDPDEIWIDELDNKKQGKAKPIATLIEAFESGRRTLTARDLETADAKPGDSWDDLSKAAQQWVLNTYRLVYKDEVPVIWCPALGTVLSNEEVTNEGKSESGDHPVYQRPLEQWIMRITAYADRLLADLKNELPDGKGGKFTLDWPEAIKRQQKNWIGKSTGAEVIFEVLIPDADAVAHSLQVFTTRPDTLFGSTFMVVSPEHPLVDFNSGLVPKTWPVRTPDAWKGADPLTDIRGAISAYKEEAARKALLREEDEDKEKTGIFAGFYARNPVNGHKIPVFIADYVSMDYAFGAIMAVPAHDDRDYAFAQRYGLDIVEVVAPPEGNDELCFTGDGTSINSPADGNSPFAITGLPTREAKRKIIAALEKNNVGTGAENYRLRDWVFSRQRYWGEPFPLVSMTGGYSVPVEAPVTLPEMADFRPATSNDPNAPVQLPLSRADDSWRMASVDGDEYERELNVMPQWAGSCWYYLRFIDPSNANAFCDTEREQFFMPVDLYVGGAEHAVLHLLYARFWHKVLYDLGFVSTPEPFKKLFNQGMITADAFMDARGVYVDIRDVEIRDGEPFHTKTGTKLTRTPGKMGKRYKNGLPPEEVGAEFGVDAFRLYEMYMGPLESSTPWSMDGIKGMQRFLQRFWRNLVATDGTVNFGGALTGDLEKLLHKTIIKVTEDIEALRFNTAIAAMIELNNEIIQLEEVPEQFARTFLLLLSPFAPHICEEIWERGGLGQESISGELWPEGDESLTVAEKVEIVVQVNGKVRARMEAEIDAEQEEIKSLGLEQPNVKAHVQDQDPQKIIVIPNRLVNIVV